MKMPVVAVTLLLGAVAAAQDPERAEALRQIDRLESRLAAMKPGEFDWGLHNELRHLYGVIGDRRKAMTQAEAIFRRNLADGYTIGVLGGSDPDKAKAVANVRRVAAENADFPHIVAACWMRVAELAPDAEESLAALRRAEAGRGLGTTAREAIEDRLLLHPANRKTWPARIARPSGMAGAPGPWSDPDDPTAWPNRASRANSDPWLARNHDEIRVMRPRLLLVNFSNEHSPDQVRAHAGRLIEALAESSRYHGYQDPEAPPFLRYEVFKAVDLRDEDRTKYNSRLTPIKEGPGPRGFDMKYRDYFSEGFARLYGVPDPREPGRFLRLDELVDGGYVHEVWLFRAGTDDPARKVGAYEVVEEKPAYDESFRKKGNDFVQAGNGGDPGQPWTGRSVRINSIDLDRGIGCAMENLGHGVEALSNSGAIPYFTRYFPEYAGFDLMERYKLPFRDLYALPYKGGMVRYPDRNTMIVEFGGKEYRVADYVCAGGSVHFAPNARGHYDLGNDEPVLSTIEDWRIGSGPGGKDLARPFTRAAFARYGESCPDCQGPWLVYWRQNMPGDRNRSRDEDGKPMKNWWPFLFY